MPSSPTLAHSVADIQVSRPRFRISSLVTNVLILSGLGLPVTGWAVHCTAFSHMSVGRHACMSAHNVLGLIFVVFTFWHAWLHRRAIAGHIRQTMSRISFPSLEILVAFAVVAIPLVVWAGHAFHVHS